MSKTLSRLTWLVLCFIWMPHPPACDAQDHTYAREGALDAHFESDDGAGIDVRGGYRLLPNFALEGNFQLYDGFNFDSDQSSNLDVIGFAFTANAKAYALTGRIQPYGLFGIGVGGLAI